MYECTHTVVRRDSELARIPRELLALLKDKYSSTVTARLLELLTERLAGSRFAAGLSASHDAGFSAGAGGGSDAALSLALLMPQLLGSPNDSLAPLASPVRPAPAPPASSLADGGCGGARDAFEASASACCQFRTVAVLALSDEVPLASVALELQFALSPLCASLRLTSDIILQRLGTVTPVLLHSCLPIACTEGDYDSDSDPVLDARSTRVCALCLLQGRARWTARVLRTDSHAGSPSRRTSTRW